MNAIVHAIPVVLVIVAESAWIWVVAGLVQEFALRAPVLGIVPLALLVGIGIVVARLASGRLGGRWPESALVLSAAVGVVGWLASAEAREALTARGPIEALAVHPGGWLAAVALLRGFAHGRPPLAEAALARLSAIGVPGIAFAAIAGGMIAEPWRSAFLADALVGSVVFVTSVTLALAIARLTAIGTGWGFDWRRNPTWIALLVVLVGVAAAIAIPASLIAAPVVQLAIAVSIGPLLLLGFIVGFELRTLRVLAIFGAGAVGVFVVLTVLGQAGLRPTAPTIGGPAAPANVSPPTEMVAVGGGVLLVLGLIVVLVLARLWMRRPGRPLDAVEETRTIDRGDRAVPRLGRPARPRRRPAPTGAETAYLALMADLDGRPDIGRLPAETPTEHARRLRKAGRAGLSLDLLAADFALARFGGVRLTAEEDRRAVTRWRTLRTSFRRYQADG